MIIDCHGHFTTLTPRIRDWRKAQLEFDGPVYGVEPEISDDEIAEALEAGQIKLQADRGIDRALFSPIAGRMGHHLGDVNKSIEWCRVSNDLVHRATTLYPEAFIGVCQLPQSPGADLIPSAVELERCVVELGFVGCNLNPDPSGGHWTEPSIADPIYYPLYEKMVELEVPAMIHTSGSCVPAVHHTGAHYLNGDTTAFMQLMQGGTKLFADFPELRFVVSHGGGAVPYHWSRYQSMEGWVKNLMPVEEMLHNVYFDTCVYNQESINLLTAVIPTKNLLFGSEMIGAGKSMNPLTGHTYDDTKRYIDATPNLTAEQRAAVFEKNVQVVYPRLADKL